MIIEKVSSIYTNKLVACFLGIWVGSVIFGFNTPLAPPSRGELFFEYYVDFKKLKRLLLDRIYRMAFFGFWRGIGVLGVKIACRGK